MKRRTSVRLLPLITTGGVILVLPLPAFAQQGPDFLFGRPWVGLSFTLGYAQPREGSDIFDFTREQLTVERGDFRAFAVQGELAVRATERLDVFAGASWSGNRKGSEFRDWIGTDDLPILQTTRFSRVPLTLGARVYLRDRGRSIGRFAWVPARWAPYLGGAAGAVFYQFEQDGEFVDFQTLEIHRDTYRSEGWAPTVHALAGAEVTVAPRVALVAEARYAWARARLDRDFVDFEKIDLSGFQATAGISLRF